ncbi:MAG: sigma-54-dependent Fis family transcriptional regulator [Betaproteobacteria bacterium]|nr:MAG: sigma-54-dependent Fis family transcriptional regulator [Betaproteobacteria bacterium]
MSTSILVVDDERAIQDTLAWCLRTDGHEVRTAGSGEEALAIMADQGFDLIISDIIMPGLSGVDLLRKARALQPRTPVVLITAFATVETAVEALREGASDYVIKPLKFDELRHRVQGLLEHRPAAQESAVLRRAVESAAPDGSLLGESAAMLAVRTQVARTGPAVSNVLENRSCREQCAHHRRKRHRQGACRPRHPRGQSPAWTTVRSHQLRSHPGVAPGEPALRARERRLHQRRAG